MRGANNESRLRWEPLTPTLSPQKSGEREVDRIRGGNCAMSRAP